MPIILKSGAFFDGASCLYKVQGEENSKYVIKHACQVNQLVHPAQLEAYHSHSMISLSLCTFNPIDLVEKNNMKICNLDIPFASSEPLQILLHSGFLCSTNVTVASFYFELRVILHHLWSINTISGGALSTSVVKYGIVTADSFEVGVSLLLESISSFKDDSY